MIYVIDKNVPMYEQPSLKSNILRNISYEAIFDAPDMGGLQYTEEEKIYWEEVILNDGGKGYIDRKYCLNQFEMFSIYISKINGSWKITMISEPPGC